MNMNMNKIQELINVSRAIGQRPDLVQGTGGNTSVKIDGKTMFIKASGWRLSEINENEGIVDVNYNNMALDEDFSNFKYPRPSMETGFHSFLEEYVIHTHPVVANIIFCAQGGENILKEIFHNFDAAIIWLPYSNPGPQLALSMKKAVSESEKRDGKPVEVILMQNHGLTVAGDNIVRVSGLHNKILELIKRRLNLTEPFPEIKITETDNGFESRTDFLKNFIRNNYFLIENFRQNILFPDQAVFCGDIGGKIAAESSGNVIYNKTTHKEALAIEEILTAWAYIVSCANLSGLSLKTISQEDVNYIKNMESEKYRQQLINK